MAPSPLQQRRTHNTLLFQKLLNLRDGASPFTLILDTLEQSGAPVVSEFARRAKIGKSKIIFISFRTLPKKVSFQHDIFISAHSKPLSALRTEILSHLPQPAAAASTSTSQPQKILLIIDTLNPLAHSSPQHLTTFLSSLLTSPLISLLGVYHTDIPLPSPFSPPSTSSSPFSNPQNQGNAYAYAPPAQTTLTYLSTAILRIHNLSHIIARKRATDRSLAPPVFGLQEQREGVLFSFPRHAAGSGSRKGRGGEGVGGGGGGGVVVEMEIRRKSGRGVVEWFVLGVPLPSTAMVATAMATAKDPLKSLGTITLLEEHPAYASLPDLSTTSLAQEGDNRDELEESTFSLGLTEKQRKDRENVVLPYFDAQNLEGGGAGEGGRILYQMGDEDREDFDDEEDEI